MLITDRGCEFMLKKKLVITLSVILAAVILITVPVAVFNSVTKGEKYDSEVQAIAYDEVNFGYGMLAVGISEEGLKSELDELDSMLSTVIGSIDIESTLFTDEVATLVTEFTAKLMEKEPIDIEFTAMKKSFPEAYDYMEKIKGTGSTWTAVETIPFGITKGDKEAFIKACGAGAEALGDALLKVVLYEPTSYYDALVPAIESTHTNVMPSLAGFVMETGLSGSARIKFMAEKILSIVEPIKTAPLSYLCEIFPDFIMSYGKACELINGSEKIRSELNFKMPEISSIVDGIVTALGMTAPKLNLNEISKMGRGFIGESGGNDGSRLTVNGNRETIFAYLADYITGLFTFENNFEVVEKIVTDVLKNSSVQTPLNTREIKNFLGKLMGVLQKLEVKESADISAEIDAYNSHEKDYSNLYGKFLTKEKVSSVITSAETKLIEVLASADLESKIFTDEIATTVSVITAKLCEKELSDISFYALSQSFPAAYSYVKNIKDSGGTFDDIETIPFGITPGNKEMFIKACGAGAEHFGDALLLCLLSDPLSYDNALVPLLESLHTGPMPSLEDFVSMQGIDSARRMEIITEKVLTILDPIKESPLTYLTDTLPDLIASYGKSAEALKCNPNAPLKLPELSELLESVAGEFGLTLPDYDFTLLENAGTAKKSQSGHYLGERVEINGDREDVAMLILSYAADIIGHENNKDTIVDLVSSLLSISKDTAEDAIDAAEKLNI